LSGLDPEITRLEEQLRAIGVNPTLDASPALVPPPGTW
jgi:hypothetical protein